MKHLIMTRFYCMNLGIDIFNENILSAGYENMIRFFIPSLNNQTNKNFKLVVMKSSKNNINGIIKKLSDIQKICQFEVFVINWENINDFINEQANNSNIILSRCDIDDSVRNDIVDIIQTNFNNTNSGYIGFNSGYEQDIKNPYKLINFNRKYQDKIGTFSIMQSIFVEYNKCKIHPYMWMHNNPSKFLNTNKIKLDKIVVDNNNRIFIRNYTGINGSYINSHKKFNEQNSKFVDIKKEDIHRLFGI